MIKSFRLRIAIYSALLAGLVLLAFGGSSWWMIRQLKLERLDDEIRTQAERVVNRPGRNDNWQAVEARVLGNLGIKENQALLILVQDSNGDTRYISSNWPDGLDIKLLQWSAMRNAAVRGAIKKIPLLINEAYAQDGVDHLSDEAFRPPPRFGPGHPPPEDEFHPARPPRPPVSHVYAQSVAGHLWRIALAANGTARVAVVVDARIIDADMNGIRNAFLVALPFALMLIGLGSWLFSGRALRPLQKLNTAIRRVTVEGLNQRISAQGEDREFSELIETYNRMLERLERSFRQANRFSADAAHELKTPLAILQGQLERAIAQVETGSAMQIELTSILDEVRRLSAISGKLLLLSQADAGRMNLLRQPFDLSEMLGELVEDTQMLAPLLRVSAEIPDGVSIKADSSMIRQVLHNLVSNAIKYNIEGGWIRLVLHARPEQVEVMIENASTGIPPAAQDRIFERFYRADPAHGRSVEGVGLGLSVSREIARAHGGDLVLKKNGNGQVLFSLLLPVTAPKQQELSGKRRMCS